MLTLHYAPGTVAIAVAIALDEAGLDYRTRRLDFAAAEQRGPDHLALNPKDRVPVLETDRGAITETSAILDYIAALAPEAALVPEDAFVAAHMRSVMTYLASTMHVNHAHKMRGARWASLPASFEDMAANVTRTMTVSTAYIEAHAFMGPFVCGDRISLADPYLHVVGRWVGGDGVDLDVFPRFAAFQAAMSARPSVRKAVASGML